MKKAKRTDGLASVALIFVISLVAEIILSNFTWLAYVAGNNTVNDYLPEQAQASVITAESNYLSFECGSIPLHSVGFDVAAQNSEIMDSFVTVTYYIFDENNLTNASSARSDKIAIGAAQRHVKTYINSMGNAGCVGMQFDEIPCDLEVSRVVINPEYEFSFNSLRFAFVFILLALAVVFKNKTGRQLRDEMTFGQAALLSCAVCCFTSAVFAVLCMTGEYDNYIVYPLEGDVEYYQPYIQQFDAFMKGQLHLDVAVSPELIALENPYSPDARDGINYLYDRAFFEGRYYSYFGIAPILTVYYPFYLLTGALPVDSVVMGIFSVAVALFLPLAVIEWAKLRDKGMRPWLAAVCAVGAYFSSAVLLIQRGRMSFYYIASLAGMAFVAAFAFFVLKAFSAKKKAVRIVFMLLAGVSFGLGFLSRINSVLSAAIIIAAFVIIYFIQSIKTKQIPAFIAEMAALALPVAAAIGFSLYYNHIRFGDILQFGSSYQLTIMNASLYKLTAGGLFNSLFYYFVQPFVASDRFPYIQLAYHHFADFGRNIYTDSNFGVFAFPFMLSLLFSPVIFRSRKVARNGKILLSVSLVSFVITAFLDFCMGGVIFRYTADITLPAALVSAVILLEICRLVQENHADNVSRIAKKSVVMLTASTVLISLSASLMLNGNLAVYDPDIYLAIKEFFVFWN